MCCASGRFGRKRYYARKQTERERAGFLSRVGGMLFKEVRPCSECRSRYIRKYKSIQGSESRSDV